MLESISRSSSFPCPFLMALSRSVTLPLVALRRRSEVGLDK